MAIGNYKAIKNDLQLGKLKRKDKAFTVKVANTSGLYVRIGPSGVKSYRWDRGKGQKPRHITYGRYPSMSVKDARNKHEKTQEQYRDGVMCEVSADLPKTIQELADVFYEGRIVPNRKRPEIVLQVLDHDVLPFVGSMKLDLVNTMVIHSLVSKVVDRGATVHAGRVLAILKQMLNYGVVLGALQFNVAQPLNKKDLGISNSQRNRVLDPKEIKLLWNALENNYKGTKQTRIGLQLLLLLGLRSGELRLIKWADIDLKKGLLTIPVENQKLSIEQAGQAKPYVVPLDKMARELFRKLEGINSEWVFPGRGRDKPIHETTMINVISVLLDRSIRGEKVLPIDAFTPHDLRRTMRSNLSELGIPPHIAERCLNHSLGGILKVYDHYDFLKERKEALGKWSQQLQIIIGKQDNVVLLERSA